MTHRDSPPDILIVDDNELIRAAVSDLLGEYLVCHTRQAASGPEALRLLHEAVPDLVLLDVTMPRMDGYAVCRALRADAATREVPVIFLTGERTTESIVKGFEAGGNDYLLKPYENRELLARVRVHIELKQQRDELKLRNSELEAALARIKRLEGIIPICMYCKKIRNDGTMWQRFEQYIEEHSDAYFTHGVCPDCFNEQCRLLEQQVDETD